MKTNQANAMTSLPVRSWRFCELLLTLKEHTHSGTVIVGSNFPVFPVFPQPLYIPVCLCPWLSKEPAWTNVQFRPEIYASGPRISVLFHGCFTMWRDGSIHIFCKNMYVIISVLTLARKYACISFNKSTVNLTILTYSLNINGIMTCIRVLSVRIAVKTLKTLMLLRMRWDPNWVRMHCDRLKQWPWLPWMQTFLQKLPFFSCVFPVTFN